jgi:chaperonin GroES
MKLVKKTAISQMIMIGDKVLIRPKTPQEKTTSGLYLPPGVEEKELVYCGYVIKAGPGFPIPSAKAEEEPWKEIQEKVSYLPLQVQEGDLVLFLQKSAIEVMVNDQKHFIVPHSGILMIEREEEFLN